VAVAEGRGDHSERSVPYHQLPQFWLRCHSWPPPPHHGHSPPPHGSSAQDQLSPRPARWQNNPDASRAARAAGPDSAVVVRRAAPDPLHCAGTCGRPPAHCGAGLPWSTAGCSSAGHGHSPSTARTPVGTVDSALAATTTLNDRTWPRRSGCAS